MSILERYMQAVRFWLPTDQKSDIVAELSEAIRSQIEERETELGRPVTDAELEQMLKAWGSPLLVAERYLPQNYLIGPKLFPVYRLVLRGALLYYLVPWMIIWCVLTAFQLSPSHISVADSIASFVRSQWVTAVYGFAAITFAFAMVERYSGGARFLDEWNPRKLPPAPDINRIRRSTAASEFAGHIFSLLWWLGAIQLPGLSGSFTLTAIWQIFYWPVCGILGASAAISAVNLARPYWTRRRILLRLGVNITATLLSAALLANGPWLDASTGDIARVLNLSAQVIIGSCLVGYAWSAIMDLRRLYSRINPSSGSNALLV